MELLQENPDKSSGDLIWPNIRLPTGNLNWRHFGHFG